MIVVLLIVLVIAALAVGAWWVVQERAGVDHLEPDARLPLFTSRATDGLKPPPQHQMSSEPPPEVAMLRRGRAAQDATTPKVNRAVLPPAADDVRANGATSALGRAVTAPQGATAPGAPPPPALAPASHGGGRDADESLPVGTLQFLPGRLEVLQGRGIVEQEVRFVRPSRTGRAPEVTFGRGEGPPFTHVQLRAPTVSRLHARLVQQNNGAWALENLSETNPVIVNGQEIARGAPARPLADGDRLEMGEVVFRYHAH